MPCFDESIAGSHPTHIGPILGDVTIGRDI